MSCEIHYSSTEGLIVIAVEISRVTETSAALIGVKLTGRQAQECSTICH